jgi:hypothetical protein
MESEPRLNEYVVVLAEYEGTGTLRCKGSAEPRCTFRTFQLRDGHVVVLCKTADAGLSWMLPFDTAVALTGTTSDGRTVMASGLSETNYLPRLLNREPGVYCAYRADVLDVSIQPTEPSSMSRFAITNLTLATSELPVSHPSGQEARVYRADGYAERVQRLYTVKGIDVTAQLEVRAAHADVRKSVADDVCYLLSVARGTKVQWVARVDYSEQGAAVHYNHASRVTKAYCPLPIIDPGHPKDTDAFLEAALPQYLAQKDKWGLAPGLIDAYLDAKAEADYLEVRGIKLAVVMEMLKEAFVAAARQPYFVRPEAEFGALRPDLEKAIGAVLSQHGWQGPQRAIVYRNLGALNRVPFRDTVTALCAHVDLALPESDLKLFVQCHRGPYIDWSDSKSPGRRDTF